MERFRNLKQYARVREETSMQTDNRSRVGSQSVPDNDNLPNNGYELRDRKVPGRALASAFVEELSNPSGPRYSQVVGEPEYNASKGLEEDHVGAGKVNTGYSPLFTRRWVLACFAILWALVIVAIQTLYSVSQSGKGLATTSTSLRYLWTYGPTAILVVITVMWRQVDYAAKYVQPWAELARGPVSARRSLLLDYITPFQISAFWTAIRLRHITVVSTILTFVLIKVMTVVSTGLLTSQFITFATQVQQMQASKEFGPTNGLPLDDIDSRAAVAVYGHEAYNMLLPNGTTLEYAYQPFEPKGDVPSDMIGYNASVDVFTADGWECETGLLTYNLSRDFNIVDSTNISEITPVSGYYNTTIKLPDCEIFYGHLDAPFGPRDQNDTHAEYGYYSMFQNVNCSNLADTDPKKQRFIISAAYSVGYGSNNQSILNSSNVVCRPTYSVQPAYVNLFNNGTLNGEMIFHGEKRQIDGLDPNDLARAIYRTVSQTTIAIAIPGSAEVNMDGFVKQMVLSTPNFNIEMLLDNDWLNRTSKIAYQRLGAQIASIYLLQDPATANTFEGTIARDELRLVVKALPTRLMEACAAVMLILTLVMLITMPQNVVPRSVESVAAVAVILARSPSLVHLLRKTGHLNNDALAELLERHRYMTTVADAPYGKTFSVRVISDAEHLIHGAHHRHIKWMRPFVLRRLVMILTLVLAVCILIVLEVLYRYSETHQGIADVDVDSLQKYAWLYAPVTVLVLLATTFNVLDFELEFLDPYSQMARGYSSPERTLLWDPLRDVSLKTSFQALKRSRYALMASSISVCFAPLLTIAVSGLFSAQVISQSMPVFPLAQNWFNITPYGGYSDASQYFAIPSLILEGNMSYPQWTYDELAFPAIDLSTQSTGVANATGGAFNAELPAVRASINCSVIPQSQIWNITVGPDSIICDDCVNFNISVADGCGNYGYADSGFVYLAGAADFPASGSGYFGAMTVSNGREYSEDLNATLDCPSFIISYGHVENRELQEYAIHQCWTGFETVQTNATIDANLATVTNVSEITSNPTVFNDYWKPGTDSVYQYVYMPTINYTNAKDVLFDPFITAMVFGKDGVPAAELTNNATFEKQFIHTYRQWTAQFANLYMRQPVDQLAQNATNTAGTLETKVRATFTKSDRHRLVLSEVSTRILQGVIAVLLICGLVILILVDMRKVLPKEVGTIGAVASLLAGGRLVDERSGLIPYGSEWRSDDELMKSGVWNGQMFRMGWWPAEEKIQDMDTHETGYSGAASHVYDSLDEFAKESGDFRIDARPRVNYPQQTGG